MEKSERNALLLALLGLVILLMTGAQMERQTQSKTLERVMLASNAYCMVYAGGDMPSGDTVWYDRDTLYKGKLLYVSRDTPLPQDMPAQQARDMRRMVGLYVPSAERVALSEEAIYALCALVEENPLLGTWVMEGMRSPQQQAQLQRAAYETYALTMPVSQALEQAEKDVLPSGQSEHQLADAFDVHFTMTLDWSQEDPLLRAKDGLWLKENSWRYGFIRRYPPEKAEITGIYNEALHFRYVGRVHAAVMQAGAWCLEEYLQILHAYGHLTVAYADGQEAHILCVPMHEAGAAFVLPKEYDAAPSADNMGYAVCTLTRR